MQVLPTVRSTCTARLLSGFDLLFSDTRSQQSVSYRIAAISHGLPFCFLFLLILIFWVAFCGLTSATRQPSAIVLWVWGADSLRASLSGSMLGVAACGDMWPTGGAFPADL